jgi:hypothetical protein
MNKMFLNLLTCGCAVVLLTGCAVITPVAGGAGGALYSNVSGPVAVGQGGSGSKVGMAKATGIICFATGDASIEAAKRSAGITKVHHVDYKVVSILGIYAEYTTIVYGE